MGLAEPKRKKKYLPIQDVATTWSATAPTSSIGFKLMSSMGWEPGKGLGTDLQGEKSNIKYALKDNLLGVGAKKEIGGGVWRGMGEVDDLYRRLDVGGSPKAVEEVKVEEVKEEVRIRGGWKMNFQVGDTYKSSFSQESEVDGQTSNQASSIEGETVKKRTNKRKRDEEKGAKKAKNSKKSKKEKILSDATPKAKKARRELLDNENSKTGNADDPEPAVKKSKKEKKPKDAVESRSKKRNANPDVRGAVEESNLTKTDVAVNPKIVLATISSKEVKAEKKAKKEKKEKRKEVPKEKSSSRGKDQGKEKSSKRTEKKSKPKKVDTIVNVRGSSICPPLASAVSVTETTISIPVDSEPPIPRHMHRSRFLAMKRASVMDQNALREILGVTA
jgi:hypothetical protein